MVFTMKINEKKIVLALFVGGAIVLVVGILLLALAVPAVASTFHKVMWSLTAVISMLLGGVLLWLAYLYRDTDANFFRYDPHTGRNIPLKEVDFDRINSRMAAYENRISASYDSLWKGDIFTECDAERFGPEEVYRPLLAYKMLYDLAEIDRDESWELFTGAEPELVNSLADALRDAGEDKMADAVVDAYNRVEDVTEIAWIRDFIKGNQKYIQRRVLHYVHKNDELFY